MSDKDNIQTHTFGCRLNAFETEVARSHAADAGLTQTIIVNTCAVTNEAVRQARQSIRRLRRDHPEHQIIVTGCAAQIDPNQFAQMTEVDHVIGNAEKMRADTYVGISSKDTPTIRVNDIMAVRETANHLVDGVADRARAYVEVQNGCDHRCTFCIIPFGRGNSRSVPAGVVTEQLQRLVDRGINEVVLTGVDLTSYGPDLPGHQSLGTLVQTILRNVPDLPRLRLSSIDSIEVDQPLLDAITSDQRLAPHLHLSLQSGDDIILKRMKRRHLRDQSIEFCQAVRRARPDVVFGADLIAGFPTETEAMFENTLKLVEDCGLTYLHVFPFSPRPGTPAARMPQLDRHAIKVRAARLREQGTKVLATYLTTQIGQRHQVLVERATTARTRHFAEVALDSPAKPGSLLDVTVAGSDGNRLLATVQEQDAA